MSDPSGAKGGDLPKFDKLWDYDHPDSTEQKFRELLPQAEQSGNLDYRLQLQTQIARALGLQQKFDEAQALLDQVKADLDAHPDADLRVARVRYLLERGRTYNSSNQKEKSIPLFEEAWRIGREIGNDRLAIDAAHMLAIVEEPEKAVEWFERGVATAEASKDESAKGWLGPLYNNLGWTYHDQGQYEKALETFQKALAYREARGQARQTRIAKWAVARALRSLDRVDEALRIQRQLLEEWKEAGEEDGYVYEELGECLLLEKKEDEARPNFAKAYELLSTDPWLATNEPDRIARLKELGGVN